MCEVRYGKNVMPYSANVLRGENMELYDAWTGERGGVRVIVMRENEDLNHEDIRNITLDLIREEL